MTIPARVRHYCPGGRESGGGIGRLVGYVTDAAAADSDRHLITDTRGPRLRMPGSLLRLAAAVAAMAADRVIAPDRIHHIHIAGRGSTVRKLVLTQAARLLGAVHVLHLHDYDYAADVARRPPWQQRAIRRMFRGAQRVIVLGKRDCAVAHDRLRVPQDRIETLNNAVPDPGERPQAAEGPARILFLGRLSERKGVPELLAALASTEMAAGGWTAVLAGDGPVEDYQRQVADLGLADRVSLPGWVDEEAVRALCRAADILVLPSHAEGLAMAVLEGLAHGLTVVTTPVGAHEEVIVDGETGVFVPPGDAKALARTLADLVADPVHRATLSRQGRNRFIDHFSMEAYMTRLQDIYQDLGARDLAPAGAR